MAAGTLHDLDGLGILVSQELYWDWHHRVGHNVFYCTLLAAVLAWFCPDRWRCFGVFLVISFSHLGLDYLGSGPGWGPVWLWPIREQAWVFEGAWPFFSWQNISAFGLVFGLTLWIARRLGRTPLELIMPRLDAKFVNAIGFRRSATGEG